MPSLRHVKNILGQEQSDAAGCMERKVRGEEAVRGEQCSLCGAPCRPTATRYGTELMCRNIHCEGYDPAEAPYLSEGKPPRVGRVKDGRPRCP